MSTNNYFIIVLLLLILVTVVAFQLIKYKKLVSERNCKSESNQVLNHLTALVLSNLSDLQIVELQLFNDNLIMDFDTFRLSLTRVLKRPVYEFEFSNIEKLRVEFNQLTY